MSDDSKLWTPCRYSDSLRSAHCVATLEYDLICCTLAHINNKLETVRPGQVEAFLMDCWSTSKNVWGAFPLIASSITNQAIPDIRSFAMTLHHYMKSCAARKWIRACIYLHSDSKTLNNKKDLVLGHEFYGKHYMLLLATLATSKNVEMMEWIPRECAKALWIHWGRQLNKFFHGSETFERILDDAWLKACADESELENDPRIVRINARPIAWEAKESNWGWYASCEKLALNTFGETYADLQDCINDSMHLWLMTLIEGEAFESELQKRGWEWSGELPKTEFERTQTQFDVIYTCKIKSPQSDIS